jgi:hypothetical protein
MPPFSVHLPKVEDIHIPLTSHDFPNRRRKLDFAELPLCVVQYKEIWLQHSVDVVKESTSAKFSVKYTRK